MDTKTMTIRELRGECDGLLEFLRELGYTEGTITNFRRALANLIAFAEGDGEPFSLDSLIEGYSHLIRSKGIGDHSKTAILGHLRRLVDRIKGEPFAIAPSHSPAEAPICFRPILEAYLVSRRDKGNKDNTLLSKRMRVASFLTWLGSSGAHDLSAFGADEVISFLNGKPEGFHTALRDFLSYLFREGTQKLDLSFFARFPGRPQKAPTSYSREELAAIESAMGGSPRDVRNRAAFLLASELGMRSGDIVRLRLGDVDIPSSRVSFVQMKNGRPMSLPLTEKAADAMKAWLAIRPGCPSEQVFVRVMHPVTPISTSCLREWLAAMMAKSGIAIGARRHGPHSLRSSLATNMVNSGVPYEAVRKVLGHSSKDAIEHYAKIDVANLRRCSLEPIAPSGLFAEEIA